MMRSLFLGALLLAAYVIATMIAFWLQQRNFAHFVRRSNAAFAKPMIKKRGLPFSIDHKIRMLFRKPEALFGQYYFKKYDVSGPTHGIYDSLGGLKAVHSIEAENLKAVLCTSFGDWVVSKARRQALKPLAQRGILTTEGTEWLHNRKFFQRHLNSVKSRDMRDVEGDVQLLFMATGEVNDEGWTLREVNMSDLLQRLTLDASTRFLFGVTAEAQVSGMLESSMAFSPEKRSDVQTAMAKYTEALQFIRTMVTARGALGSAGWMADSFKVGLFSGRYRRL
jgi:cytochrome P450